GGQLGLGLGQQHVPLGHAGEQLTFEADRAGLQRRLLGVRQRRQDLGVEAQRVAGDQRLPQRGDQQRQGGGRQQARRHPGGGEVGAGQAGHHQQAAGQGGEHGQRPALVGHQQSRQQQGEEGGEDGEGAHRESPEAAAFGAARSCR